MSTTIPTPAAALVAAAQAAGLTLTSAEAGHDFTGAPTTRATIALPADPSRSQVLELSEAFDASDPRFAPACTAFFTEAAQRLRNPRPNCYLTLHGLPLSFGSFAWPFHPSTTGADTFIVHGTVHLADGADSPLHAKISAALTRTFAETLPALEQPFAEGFITNAVRKTFDQGQLELVKSGNRQPVPVTTRYYSVNAKAFSFNDTTARQRHDYLAAKVFWLSHILGNDAPVWITDPRDAQYLNTTSAELKKTAAALASDSLLSLSSDGDWATPTPALLARRPAYEATLQEVLTSIKPAFNEDMRGGHTNM
jgi:hypothetical protein